MYLKFDNIKKIVLMFSMGIAMLTSLTPNLYQKNYFY